MNTALTLAVLWATAGATDWRLDTGVATDSEAGVQTVQLGQPSVAIASLAIVPSAGIRIARRAVNFGATYNLRLFRRFELQERAPGTVGSTSLERFLVYHSANANVAGRISKGWGLSASADFSVGELDLPNAPGLLGQAVNPSNPTMPNPSTPTNVVTDSDTVKVITLNARAAFGGQLNGRTAFTASINTLYNASQLPEGSTAAAFPTQLVYGFDTTFRYGLSKTQGVGFGTGVSFSNSDQGGDFRNMTGTVSYDHTIARGTVWNVSAGILSIVVTDPGMTLIGTAGVQRNSLLPTVSTSLSYALFRGRRFRVSGNSQLGLQGAPNLATGRFEPRATAAAGVALQLRPRWTFGLSGVFTSPVVFDDQDPNMPATLFGDTTLTAALPISVALAKNVSFSFGGRLSAFGPRIDTPNFKFQNLNATAFVNLAYGRSFELY